MVVATALRPIEVVDRARKRMERRLDRSAPVRISQEGEPATLVHDFLAATLPCAACAGFNDSWSTLMSTGNHSHFDAGTAFAEALWAVMRHTRCDRVVETGVGRGVTTAVILSGLAADGLGHLWSIDLPDLDLERKGQVASCVPAELLGRWTYLRGGTRRLLPLLLRSVGEVNLFVHDSQHTYGTMMFEFTRAWGHLARGGMLVSDDIHANSAFFDFAQGAGADFLAIQEPRKDSAFGLIRKPS
jgi:hypothetical protein